MHEKCCLTTVCMRAHLSPARIFCDFSGIFINLSCGMLSVLYAFEPLLTEICTICIDSFERKALGTLVLIKFSRRPIK